VEEKAPLNFLPKTNKSKEKKTGGAHTIVLKVSSFHSVSGQTNTPDKKGKKEDVEH